MSAPPIDRWTQSTVWYLFIPIMEKYGIKVTRKYVTRLINVICKELGVARESLGIIASPRAQCIIMVYGLVLVLIT